MVSKTPKKSNLLFEFFGFLISFSNFELKFFDVFKNKKIKGLQLSDLLNWSKI